MVVLFVSSVIVVKGVWVLMFDFLVGVKAVFSWSKAFRNYRRVNTGSFVSFIDK